MIAKSINNQKQNISASGKTLLVKLVDAQSIISFNYFSQAPTIPQYHLFLLYLNLLCMSSMKKYTYPQANMHTKTIRQKYTVHTWQAQTHTYTHKFAYTHTNTCTHTYTILHMYIQ